MRVLAAVGGAVGRGCTAGGIGADRKDVPDVPSCPDEERPDDHTCLAGIPVPLVGVRQSTAGVGSDRPGHRSARSHSRSTMRST